MPAKRGRPRKVPPQAADGDQEALGKAPQETDENIPEEGPKMTARAKRTPSKKTPAKKTPAKKTPATDRSLPTGEGAVQPDNGTPKPKRKYVRKQMVKEVEEPEKIPEDSPVTPAEGIEPGGRRQRGAAKA